MITDRTLANMLVRTHHEFHNASEVHTERWQGADISKRPDMVSYEVLNWHCDVPLYGEEKLDAYQSIIEPNLPWADDHFLERVGGEPLNPGVQWANWPWAASADKHRVLERQSGSHVNAGFNHTYMERYWPRWARVTPQGQLPGNDERGIPRGLFGDVPNYGVAKSELGDMKSLVDLLANEPLTRQAWIPIFFPEDTGIGDGGRKPCTLGYQFIMRDGKLSVYYPLRSCDFIRHFRDDVYMTIRLLLWVLDRCREINPEVWTTVSPGHYVMHATSLHIFKNDYLKMFAHSSNK